MTPDEIRNLKPGPELDRAVGLALGASPRVEWYLLNADESAVTTAPFDSESEATAYHQRMLAEYPTWVAKYHVGKLEIWPRFSETWAGLGLVVEAMERRGWRYCIYGPNLEDDCHTIFWSDDIDDVGTCGVNVIETTCRAALLALAAQKGQQP